MHLPDGRIMSERLLWGDKPVSLVVYGEAVNAQGDVVTQWYVDGWQHREEKPEPPTPPGGGVEGLRLAVQRLLEAAARLGGR
jgi:hypothetical protein